ncbi:MAG TPA: hypothetical protein VFT48_06245 [Pyrinomonadaceae bacterium]|nr:hypothetical protein [Pyrinomonadaceae bacterium]
MKTLKLVAFRILFALLLLTPTSSEQHFAQAPAGTLQGPLAGTTGVFSEEWFSIGSFGMPLNNLDVISGQVNAIAVHPRDADTLYIGASEGGVWKTTDGGATWVQLTDFALVRDMLLPDGGITPGATAGPVGPIGPSSNSVQRKATLSVGAIAIDPISTAVVYVGTGDPNRAANIIGPSLGVFRTVNAGRTWTPMGTNLQQTGCSNGPMSRATVNKIVVISLNPALVLAATDVGLATYREDGTDCWKLLRNGLPTSGNAFDLAVDNFRNVFYVAFSGNGIFRSTDPLTQPWTKLTNGLPSSDFGRIALTFAGRTLGLSNPQRILYAGYATGPSQATYRLFKTINGGDSWTELPSPPSQRQLHFNTAIAVGLYSPDDLYIGQVSVWKTTDGGRKGGLNNFKVIPVISENSWTNISCCLSHPANPFRRGLDVHPDIHDLVFAPIGSFNPTPSQIQILYVANDGGVTKGVVNFEGVVTWQPLTQGLAIGQVGGIGLSPRDPSITVSGLWHNGNAWIRNNVPASLIVGGGDGVQAKVDAAVDPTVYTHCNKAADSGEICRSKMSPSAFPIVAGSTEKIWADKTAKSFWTDPYRPGHLLRLQAGLLFRTKNANTATAATLRSPDAWEAVDPFFGKTGATTTVAFRSALLESQPVYYLGTNTGQIWRGSPEVRWQKICECGASINAIGPDFVRNERVFAVLAMPNGPGRIKEIKRRTGNTWAVNNIDDFFLSDFPVEQVTSVVMDPLVPEKDGTTVYVGTEHGVYRGHVAGPLVSQPSSVVSQTAIAAATVPTIFDWSWRRSPGVPNVTITEMEVHQSLFFLFQTGVIRAGTYGRGVFQLNRSPGGTADPFPMTLDVSAVHLEDDGAPPLIKVKIAVVTPDRKFTDDTPFRITPSEPQEVTLEAPLQVLVEGRLLKFVGWVVSGKPRGTSNKIELKINEAVKAAAFYEGKQVIPFSETGNVPRISVKANTESFCVDGLSHQINATWEILNGRESISLVSQLTFPDGHVETTELKPTSSPQQYPLNFPAGGDVKIKMTLWESNKVITSAETSVRLNRCR